MGKSVVIIVLAAIWSVASLARAAYPPNPPSCTSKDSGHGGFNCLPSRPAVIPVDKNPPVFIRSVKNGKRYLAGSGNDTFHVAHLYSETDNLYDMGFALGQLFPQEIADMFDTIEPWLISLLEKSAKWLPPWLAQLVVEFGAPIAIDFVYDMTSPWIPKEYLDEWQGIADGANCSIQRVRRVALFPQLSKAACTIFIAHDNATEDKGVRHLRALDFDPTSHVANYASVVIHHYKNKPQLANFGWIAMPGVLTGMNDVPMSVGEKKWGGHGALLNIPLGLPWMQMMRQSLELRNLTAVEKYVISHSKATSSDPNSVAIHMGYGDQKMNKIIGFEVGYNYSKEYHWNTHGAAPTHPLFPGIVYWTKNDDANTMCPADMMKAQYGNITAEWMAMYYSPNDMTGDTQMVAFDLPNMEVWVANSRKQGSDGPLCAYYRQRTVLNMKALFAEKP